jgi:hypothetical protein
LVVPEPEAVRHTPDEVQSAEQSISEAEVPAAVWFAVWQRPAPQLRLLAALL